MMIYAAKIQWKEMSALLTLAAAFLLCLWGGGARNGVSVSVSSETAAAQQPLELLTELGWEVSGSAQTDYVMLPDHFGPEYREFLSIQAKGGFDLAAYAGETVVRYSFPIANFPTGEEGVMADLLVLDGTVVGGELRSPKLDGFMAPLVAPEALQFGQSGNATA